MTKNGQVTSWALCLNNAGWARRLAQNLIDTQVSEYLKLYPNTQPPRRSATRKFADGEAPPPGLLLSDLLGCLEFLLSPDGTETFLKELHAVLELR